MSAGFAEEWDNILSPPWSLRSWESAPYLGHAMVKAATAKSPLAFDDRAIASDM
jgi:hypothetical protein